MRFPRKNNKINHSVNTKITIQIMVSGISFENKFQFKITICFNFSYDKRSKQRHEFEQVNSIWDKKKINIQLYDIKLIKWMDLC